MNYPIWELPRLGGGTLIAIIAIVHVYISHLAVGGGLFIWITDLRATKRQDAALAAYIRRHTWFFLLLTMVLGGMTGVGIWFVISLVQPQATSILIHNFVFGWAIEWVFFVGELVSLLVYHLRGDKMADRDRLRVAFLYFAFAWLSLLVINGILSFMLTPGRWVETQDFWDGFLNPGFLPSLAFRTCIAAILAGLFAYVTAVRIREEPERRRMVSYAGKWLLYPLVPLALSAAWYYLSLPADLRARSLGVKADGGPFFLVAFLVATALIFVAGVLMSRRSSLGVQRGITAFLLVIGLGWIGAYEYAREIARKPYIIGDVLYSDGIVKGDVPDLSDSGALPKAKWTLSRSVNGASGEAETLAAGKDLFALECMACHTVGGVRNDILPRIKPFTYMGIVALLSGQGSVNGYMPPFAGTEAERDALARYLTVEFNHKKVVTEPEAFAIPEAPASPSPETAAPAPVGNRYVLLAWNDLGMHCISDNEAYFSFLPPANFLYAQIIERGAPPRIVYDGATVEYALEDGYRNPSAHVAFWKYSKPIFGKQIPDNEGLFGKSVSGTLDVDPLTRAYEAPGVPALPYKDDGSYDPYPLATVTAKDATTGKLMMSTKAVLPVSSEMGCRNCHDGPWRIEGQSGVSDETSRNFLALHDATNGTTLLSDALAGRPALCQSCHADPVLGAEGVKGVLNFSSAMHGWHANFIDMDDGGACQLCHPSSLTGNTRCLRGVHGTLGLDCTQCHGTLKQHAMGLLNAQKEKPAATKLIGKLELHVTEKVQPRTPWLQEPDCLNCHKGFQEPAGDFSGFNRWTSGLPALFRSRTDDRGIRCEACHGSTHAVYPADNPYGRDRDNIQVLQYGGTRGPIGSSMTCSTCHTDKVTDASGHHANMSRPFRNDFLLED